MTPPAAASSPPPPPRKPRPLRDVDSAKRAQTMVVWAWGGVPGAFLGGMLGIILAATRGYSEWILFPAALAGGVGVPLLAQFIASAGGDLVRHTLLPSGSSTPSRREYSYAASLAARGRYEDAVDAYRQGAEEHPDDPTPLVAAARIAARELKRPEEAAGLYRQAQERVLAHPGKALSITHELMELLASDGGDPRRALPELARMAHLLEGTPEGEVAARELAALKEELLGGPEEV